MPSHPRVRPAFVLNPGQQDPRPLTPAPSSPSIEPSKSSIMPFRALKRPLQFLGLFETSLCRLTHIPAYKVREGEGEGRRGGAGSPRGGMGRWPGCLPWG